MTIERGYFEVYKLEPLEIVVPPPTAVDQQVSCKPLNAVYDSLKGFPHDSHAGALHLIVREDDSRPGTDK